MEPVVIFAILHQCVPSKISKENVKDYVADRSVVDRIIQRRPYTCVILNFTFDGEEYTSAGFSKVCYPDKWSSEEGMSVAFEKAVDDIVEQLTKNYSKS